MQEALDVSDSWDGDAADDFHDYGDDLPQAFERGGKSLLAAAKALGKWANTLKANQEEADRLEREAKKLKHQLETATEAVGTAQVAANRAHGVAHQTTANNALTTAALDQLLAQQAFDDVLERAQRLKAKHLREANATAEAIGKDSDDSFKPENDGWFVQAVDGVASASGIISAVAGTIAVASLVIPGVGEVVAPIAGTIAMSTAGIGSLAGIAQRASGSRHKPSWVDIGLGLAPTKVVTTPLVKGGKVLKTVYKSGSGATHAAKAAGLESRRAMSAGLRDAPIARTVNTGRAIRSAGLQTFLHNERAAVEHGLREKGEGLAAALNRLDKATGGTGHAMDDHLVGLGKARSAHESVAGTIDSSDKIHHAVDPTDTQTSGEKRGINAAKAIANPGRNQFEVWGSSEAADQLKGR